MAPHVQSRWSWFKLQNHSEHSMAKMYDTPSFIGRVCAFLSSNDAVVDSVRTPPVAVYVFDEIPQNIGAPVLPEPISFYRDRIAKISIICRVRFYPTSETVCSNPGARTLDNRSYIGAIWPFPARSTTAECRATRIF